MSERAVNMNTGRPRAAVRGTTANWVFGLSFLGVAAFAAALEAQTYSFNSVSVTGNELIEDSTILSYAGIARGESVGAGDLNEAAQRIRESGLFQSVEVSPQGGTLAIRVTEYPTVNLINFEGNNRISDDQLASLVGSQERRVYNPVQAERDAAAITQAYADAGRIGAVVRPALIPRSDNRVDLVFEVVESGLTEVQRISFVGNRSYSESRLRRVLETKQAGALRAIIQRDTFNEDRLDFDRRVLTDFYNSRGYPDFQIQSVNVELTRERDAYLVTWIVQEGQQYRIGDVSVSSEVQGAAAEEFLRAARLRSGVTYSPNRIETDITRLETLAIRKGLDFVRVDPRITRDERNQILNVEYVLVPGERIFVERIDIEGNTTTLDRVIRARFQAVEGDPFNPRSIRESAERIRALGFFSSADVQTREGSSPDQVVIDVDVVEQPTGSLSFGANYNSDSGASLLVGFSERNFLGRGQSIGLDLAYGADTRNFSFNFAEPTFLGRDLRFGVTAGYRTTDNASAVYDTQVGRFSPSLAFPVSENGRLSVFYAYEYTDITDVSGDRTDDPADRASLVIFEEADEGAISTHALGYVYSLDTRRAGIDPNTNYALRFGQEFGVGDTQFIKTTASATAETKVWNEEVTLRATLEGGALQYSEGESRVTDRFFLGSRIFRGFERNGIGPRDADTGDALGGNYYAVARLEAEFPLGLPEEYNLSGGVFVDHGSVWDVGDTHGVDVLYNDFTARTVAGVSLFWGTPIGPLRFNFTEPLDVQDEDETKSFDITISTSF